MTNPIDWKLIFDATTTGVGYIVDEKKREDLLTKISLLINRKRKIVVFGNSGCGKSQFINSLKDSVKIPTKTNTPEKIRFALEKFPIKLIDTPGDLAAKPFRIREIHRIINDGVEGIINVVSYGFQETIGAAGWVCTAFYTAIRFDCYIYKTTTCIWNFYILGIVRCAIGYTRPYIGPINIGNRCSISISTRYATNLDFDFECCDKLL